MYEVVEEGTAKTLKRGDFRSCVRFCQEKWPDCYVDGNGEDFGGKPMTAYVSDAQDEPVAEIRPA